MNTVIHIHADGSVHTLSVKLAKKLGPHTKHRASHVEPVNRIKRAAFHGLRRLFGEDGRVGNWTRHWLGPWQVRFPGDKAASFTHGLRGFCIAWEIETINARLAAGQKV